MTKHPLTDEILEQFGTPADQGYADMGRLFFDDDMRAAADWQLEKCDEWMESVLLCLMLDKRISVEEMTYFHGIFKRGVRPTQEDNS